MRGNGKAFSTFGIFGILGILGILGIFSLPPDSGAPKLNSWAMRLGLGLELQTNEKGGPYG